MLVNKPFVYVASAYRDVSHYQILKNIEYNRDLCRILVTKNFIPYSPHLQNYCFSGPDIPEETFMTNSLELFERFDGIVMGDKWNFSPGCKIEYKEAKKIGLPILLYPNSSPDLDILLVGFFKRCLDYRKNTTLALKVKDDFLSETKKDLLEEYQKEKETRDVMNVLEDEESEEFDL